MKEAAAAALGAAARISGWLGLTLAFGALLGWLWGALEPTEGPAATFLGSGVTAAAALLAGALLIRTADGRSPAALGIGVSRETPRHLAFGLLIGAGALAIAAGLLGATSALGYTHQGGTAASWLVAIATQGGIFAVAALAEEVVFRGYGFQVLARTAGTPAAIAVSSLLFALAHGANPAIGVFALVNIFLAGILLAVAYLRTLSLWFATALHLGWNWAMATLFDLPVSGIQVFDTPLYEPVTGGAAWWSGAAFGPEGGLVGTIGFAVALALTLRWRALRPDAAIMAARPLIHDTERGSDVG